MNIAPSLLYALTLVFAVALLVLALVTTGVNVGHEWYERRAAKRLAVWRPRLLAALEGDADLTLDGSRRDHATFIALARRLLPTLRGVDLERLTEMLEASGVIDVALVEVHARSAIRRARAADLLGLAGVERAIPELLRLLDDADPDVRRVAARALGQIDAVAAVPALLERIEDGSVPLNTITMALLRMSRDAVGFLLLGLGSPHVGVRAVCAELLGRRSALSAIGPLAHALETDPALEVRIRAARALGSLSVPTSVDALSSAMRADQPTPLRAVATRALGRIGSPRAVSLLREALTSDDHVVAMNAAQALAALGDEGEEVLRWAAQDPASGPYAREGLSTISLRRAQRLAVPA